VRVNVDAAGKVIAAESVGSGGPVAEALADSAVSAVKRWQFEPARRGGDKVPGEIVLSFAFRK
jgi:TonB family protein